MTTRRQILMAMGTAALPLRSFAQQPTKRVYRLGILNTDPSASAKSPVYVAQALQELGYVEGKNIVLEKRFADNAHDRLPALAADLVQKKSM